MSETDARRGSPPAPAGPRSRPRKTYGEMSGAAMLVLQAMLGLALLAAWQVASGRLVDRFFISNPVEIAGRLVSWVADGSLFVHVWATVTETAAGFAIGAAIGGVLGIGLGLSPFMSRLVGPYLWAFNALPKVALAPLFVLWVGLGIASKIALAAVLVVFIVYANTYAGVREVDREFVDSVRLMRGTKGQVLTKVVIPSALSWMFAGFRVAVPYALIGAIIGEMIAANRGLGYLVQRAGSEFDTAGVFAVLVVIAILAVLLHQIIDAIQSRFERWKVVGR